MLPPLLFHIAIADYCATRAFGSTLSMQMESPLPRLGQRHYHGIEGEDTARKLFGARQAQNSDSPVRICRGRWQHDNREQHVYQFSDETRNAQDHKFVDRRNPTSPPPRKNWSQLQLGWAESSDQPLASDVRDSQGHKISKKYYIAPACKFS